MVKTLDLDAYHLSYSTQEKQIIVPVSLGKYV